MAETRTKTRSGRRPKEDGPSPAAAPSEGGGQAPPVCTVAFCPICMVVTAAQGAAPDTVEHLLKAAQEFFLAARALIDVRADHLEGERKKGPTKLEKIEIA